MTFKNYDATELKTCGDAFVQRFRNSPADVKSKDILEWFKQTAARAVEVYGRYASGYEYMLDQCHTTFPKPVVNEPYYEQWVRALKRPLVFCLALESEWGRASYHKLNLTRVLDDAWKLATVRARVKVVVYASTGNERALPIVDNLKELRLQSRDDAPWLCIDIPWNQKRITPRTIRYQILELSHLSESN